MRTPELGTLFFTRAHHCIVSWHQRHREAKPPQENVSIGTVVTPNFIEGKMCPKWLPSDDSQSAAASLSELNRSHAAALGAF
jgi:hypothetical protein